ncbi:MAG: AraC family transcriptional regulator [Parasphingorhabdus sp.]
MMQDRVKCGGEFWNAAEAIGLKRSEILREAKLPFGIASHDATMTTDQMFALWRAVETLGGPDAAFDLGSAMVAGALPPNFVMLFHAKNLGDAINRMARYKALSAPEVFELNTGINEFSISISFPCAKTPIPDGVIDSSFLFFVNTARTCTETHVTPKRIELPRKHSQKIEKWFDCPIRWNAQSGRLVFSLSDLDLPFTQYNRELLDMLDTVLDGQLSEQSKTNGSYTEQVRWYLHRRLSSGRPNLASIAEDMAVSERSLQRHLRQEGHSFQTILSETRHQVAKEYLAQPSLELSEIAYLLGYEDQGSFFRAFQKWEGQTPSDWREANLQS